MPRRSQTLGGQAVCWVETWCQLPSGRPVQLTAEHRGILARIFDGGEPADPAGPLAAYLVLLSLAGPPEARSQASSAAPPVDFFSIWNAAGPHLRRHLQRRGETITCGELGTRWPSAAA